MIGAVSSIGGRSGVYYNPYSNQGTQQAQQAQSARPAAAALTAHKAASPELPVQPVTAVKPVSTQTAAPVSLGLPIREGVDPVEMAVRMRIQPYEESQNLAAAQNQSVLGKDSAAKAPIPGLPDNSQKAALPGLSEEQDALQGQKAEESKSAQEVMEEGECQTCKERKYQDGSDDPGVSFKTPTKMDPSQAAAAVRGHEMEHVTREQAKAVREDRKVVSQSVTYHTDICPECGEVYVSGGTTRTVTAANNSPQQEQQSQQKQQQYQPFSAIA